MSKDTTIVDILNLSYTSRVINKLRRLTLDLCSIFAIYLAVDQEKRRLMAKYFHDMLSG